MSSPGAGWVLVPLLLLALLMLLPAQTNALWISKLLVVESAHVLALLALLWLLAGSVWPASQRLLLLILVAVLVWPAVQAIGFRLALPGRIAAAFPMSAAPHPPLAASPWSAVQQWPLLRCHDVELETHSYRSSPEPLQVDVYEHRTQAGSALRRPWLLVVHGGAWRSGNRREQQGFNCAMARQGYVVFAVDYRLAPAWHYPAPLEDLEAAVVWIDARAESLRLDPARGHVLGRSAGGQLALELAYGPLSHRFRLAVGLYAPADMIYAGTAPFNRRIIDARAVLADYLGARHAERPELYSAASPLLKVRPGLPPTLLLHGHGDVMVAFVHTRRLAAALKAVEVPVLALDLPWMEHGGDVWSVGPSAWVVFDTVLAALRAVAVDAPTPPDSLPGLALPYTPPPVP